MERLAVGTCNLALVKTMKAQLAKHTVVSAELISARSLVRRKRNIISASVLDLLRTKNHSGEFLNDISLQAS